MKRLCAGPSPCEVPPSQVDSARRSLCFTWSRALGRRVPGVTPEQQGAGACSMYVCVRRSCSSCNRAVGQHVRDCLQQNHCLVWNMIRTFLPWRALSPRWPWSPEQNHGVVGGDDHQKESAATSRGLGAPPLFLAQTASFFASGEGDKAATSGDAI